MLTKEISQATVKSAPENTSVKKAWFCVIFQSRWETRSL